MKYLAIIALVAATPAYSATLSPTDAANHTGENATVEGVASVYVSKGGTIFVDLGGSGRSAPFTGVIFKDKASAVPNVTQYDGKTVDITGLVKQYRGKPEIIINSASQIVVK
jgi:DNA/RNA endonuclease YhcR with UshA esterase domain